MTTLTLLVKAWNGGQLKQIEELLKVQFEELAVEMKVLISKNKWVQVSVSGEDEAVASSFIRKEIGVCPVTLETVGNETVLKGYVTKIDNQQLMVDVGVFEPTVTQVVVPLANLQEQLVGGKEVELKKISEIYGVAEGLPISVKITSNKAESLQAELSPEHVEKLHAWQQSLLDRLIVLRVSKELVLLTLERTRLERDVIDVEALGLFEYALTCKLGTDATGLIPRVGRYMRNAVFVVFNAKKNVAFLGEE